MSSEDKLPQKYFTEGDFLAATENGAPFSGCLHVYMCDEVDAILEHLRSVICAMEAEIAIRVHHQQQMEKDDA